MILVAYFSATGKTAALAERIAKKLDADLFEIEPQVKYTKADLIWVNPFSRSSKEMKDKSSRPAIQEKPLDLSKYDTIYLGFPIWWYVAPHIINSFLETYDFSGKTIVLFATSGGSDFGRTLEVLEDSVHGTAHLMEGRILNGKQDKDSLKSWVDSLGL